MANHDHVSTVRTIYDCFGRDDIDGLLAHLDPDVAWDTDWGMPPPPGFTAGRGHDVVRAFFSGMAAYDLLQFEPLAFLGGDGWVAVPIRFEMRHRQTSGRAADIEVHLWRFGRSGKAVWFRHILDGRQFDAAWKTVPENAS